MLFNPGFAATSSITLANSFSQIFLQKSAVAGAFLMIGIAINSFQMLLAGIAAAATGSLTALLLKFPKNNIHQGLYGFNAALVGVATMHFYKPTLLGVVMMLFAAALSAMVMHFTITRMPKLPPLTSAFVLSTWLLLLIGRYLDLDVNEATAPINTFGFLQATVLGVGQVMFQGYWFSGVLVLIGISFGSISDAIYAVVGSALGIIMARVAGLPTEDIFNGIYSFNAVLTCIFLSRIYTFKLVFILLGVILSVAFTALFIAASIPTLTAPFVISCWLCQKIINTFDLN